MNDSEFADRLTRLYENVPPARDERRFLDALARRHAAARRERALFLGGVFAAGATATLYWAIRWDVLSCCSLVQWPLRLLDAAANNWLTMIFLFAVLRIWWPARDGADA